MSWDPLILSLRVSLAATLLSMLLGLPLAWLLARRRVPLAELLSSLLLLPIVLPPTVVGYYLLLAVGRQSPLGKALEARTGLSLVFTPEAAVLAATVVSLPLIARAAQAAFEGVDRHLEDAARVFGASEWAVFTRVTVPLAGRGILAGTVLAFARAMGEFGATLMVAGNIPGRTQTLSVAIYDAVQAGNDRLANGLVLVISALTVTVLLLAGRLVKRDDAT